MTITMYGADWCGDCRRAKAWFEANGVDYTYVDLVDNPDETERVLERNNGVKKIPVIVFPDDSHLVEPTNDELASKMAELASTSSIESDTASGTPTESAIDSGPESEGPESEGPASDRESEGPAVVENTHLSRFELLHHGDVVSFATYTTEGSSVVVSHVETAAEHRGNGYGGQLMEGLLATLRKTDRTIIPRCPFAAHHISKNPQHHDVLAPR